MEGSGRWSTQLIKMNLPFSVVETWSGYTRISASLAAPGRAEDRQPIDDAAISLGLPAIANANEHSIHIPDVDHVAVLVLLVVCLDGLRRRPC